MPKLNFVTKMQHWMDSVPGQTFLNYAYSWGASVVILGALFKLTHLPGGNLMLFLGMGTEAFVFFLAAFDRPFDKTSVGKELPNDFETEDEIARAEAKLQGGTAIGGGVVSGGSVISGGGVVGGGVVGGTSIVAGEAGGGNAAEGFTAGTGSMAEGPAVVSGGVIVMGGGTIAQQPVGQTVASAQPGASTPARTDAATDAETDPIQQALNEFYDTPEGEESVERQADKLATIIRLANDELLRRAQAVLSPEMEAATKDYIEKLQSLNDTLAKVDEQSARLTRDSQEMENLNRTLIGINKVYDLHFASISRQVTTIEDINEQTRQLAAKIEEVNNIYARMMQQLAVMTNPMGHAAPPANNTEE